MPYPTSLDSFTSPTANQTLNAPSHSGIETAQNVALAAIETKVGVTGSAVTSSLDYQVTNTSSSNPGHKHTFSSLSDFNVGTPAVGDILQYNGTKFANTANSALTLKFGGTGADGALNISSGTTTINASGAAIVMKNYTSISITGTGILAFSNPHANGTTVVLKSQGAVTLTSSQAPMVNMVSIGAAGGAAVSAGNTDGNPGGTGLSLGWVKSNGGAGGLNGAGGAGGAINSLAYQSANINMNSGKYDYIFVGGGGASGRNGTGTSGVGGNGGGALIIECGGAFNFTTSAGISVAGGTGGTATGTNGGGGGGGGGFCGIFYNVLTANTGTITVSGGTGGGGNTVGGGGGGGGIAAGSSGTQPTGGAGSSGLSLVAFNSEYA